MGTGVYPTTLASRTAKGPQERGLVIGAPFILGPFLLSFETDEQGALVLNARDFGFEVEHIRSVVVKALAGTNAGTLTPANSVGAMATGVVTIALSAALGEEDSSTPTTNKQIAKGTDFTLTPAKVTDGGKVLVTVYAKYL